MGSSSHFVLATLETRLRPSHHAKKFPRLSAISSRGLLLQHLHCRDTQQGMGHFGGRWPQSSHHPATQRDGPESYPRAPMDTNCCRSGDLPSTLTAGSTRAAAPAPTAMETPRAKGKVDVGCADTEPLSSGKPECLSWRHETLLDTALGKTLPPCPCKTERRCQKLQIRSLRCQTGVSVLCFSRTAFLLIFYCSFQLLGFLILESFQPRTPQSTCPAAASPPAPNPPSIQGRPSHSLGDLQIP